MDFSKDTNLMRVCVGRRVLNLLRNRNFDQVDGISSPGGELSERAKHSLQESSQILTSVAELITENITPLTSSK